MPRIILGGIESSLVISISIGMEKPAATDSATHNPISPLVLRVGDIDRIGIIGISIFRDELFAHEDDDQEDDDLEDGLAYDVFEHGFVDDVVISAVGLSFEELGSWVLGC